VGKSPIAGEKGPKRPRGLLATAAEWTYGGGSFLALAEKKACP
jgi:hypothetical protein